MYNKKKLGDINYEILKGNKIIINTSYEYLLCSAAKYGYFNIVRYAVQNGANVHADNDWALRLSAEYGHFKIIKYLINNGANVHAGGDKALQKSVANGYFNIVKYLVSEGANIHMNNDCALRWSIECAVLWSAYHEHIHIARFSVSKGADINILDNIYKKQMTEYLEKYDMHEKIIRLYINKYLCEVIMSFMNLQI